MLLLARTQVGADFEDAVATRQFTEFGQARSNPAAIAARARTQLEDLAAERLEQLRALVRHAARKQAGQFRRRHEITGPART